MRYGVTFVVLFLFACGSSNDDTERSASGVGNSKKISELSSGDLETVCGWAKKKADECKDSDFGTVDACVKLLDESGCTAMVSETEACVEAMAKDCGVSPMKISACDAFTPCLTSKDDLPKTEETPPSTDGSI